MTAALGFNVVLTALLSAALTWATAWWFYKRRVATQLEQTLNEIQTEFEQRVKAGVLAAGEELLPQLREQVKLGFQDALKGTEAAEMVENYATVVNRGTDLLANRLGTLFGILPKK